MSSWVGNPGRPPYVIPRGSAGLKKKTDSDQSLLLVSVFLVPFPIGLAWFSIQYPPHIEQRAVLESFTVSKTLKVLCCVSGPAHTQRSRLGEPVCEPLRVGTCHSKFVTGRELRKYTLGDRAGTEEFNDDRIASECSQGVHLNIP